MDDVRAGERVYLRMAPRNAGTVSHVNTDGFKVVYDMPERKPGKPRPRFSYPWAMAPRFVIGRPAAED
jgi:hypothetical protein